MLLEAHERQGLGRVLARRHHQHVVSGGDLRVPPGDERVAIVHDRRHDPVPAGDLGSQLAEAEAGQWSVGLDVAAEHGESTIGELDHLGDTALPDEPDELAGQGLAGIDDHIDTVDAVARTEGSVLDPGHLGGNVEGCCLLAGEDVHGIGGGHRDHQFGVVDPCLPEHRSARTVPFDHQCIEVTLEFGRPHRIRLDDNDVLTLHREPLGEVRADGAGADDDDAHTARSVPMTPPA